MNSHSDHWSKNHNLKFDAIGYDAVNCYSVRKALGNLIVTDFK